MSKITIEEINGKQYTGVWHVSSPPKCGTLGKRFSRLNDGCLAVFAEAECMSHLATALPALPRRPKPEHAPLLYRYMAEGMQIKGRFYTRDNDWEVDFMTAHPESVIWQEDGCKSEITHATHNGERVSVAITDEAHNG